MQTMTRPDRPLVDSRVDSRVSEALTCPLPGIGLAPHVPLGIPVPTPRPDVLDRPGHRAKRLLDITISLLALIILAPVMLLVALAVRLGSPGPALFRQDRVGQNGRTFSMVKFRSMCHGADAELVRDAGAHRRYQENGFKLDADDPSITRVGRFIRATSLDELPQLLNVLAGEMSLVGIRPVVAEQLALRPAYDQACYRAMKPGMTGLWQVSGRSSVENCDRSALDREYIETWSVEADLKVLLRTPIAVLRIGDTR
jgi:lipopolysaccharide/colanic/teichoic acid biosynthesis glycosyltransferase